jgi:hypothetical protein
MHAPQVADAHAARTRTPHGPRTAQGVALRSGRRFYLEALPMEIIQNQFRDFPLICFQSSFCVGMVLCVKDFTGGGWF